MRAWIILSLWLLAVFGSFVGAFLLYPKHIPYVAPTCNQEASPSIIVYANGQLGSAGVDEIASKLQAAGWVSIHTDFEGGVVSADCHHSKSWV